MLQLGDSSYSSEGWYQVEGVAVRGYNEADALAGVHSPSELPFFMSSSAM